MARSGNIFGIIPTETELNLDGFFLGQLVCPKRYHIARWNVAKVSFFSGLDLSIGPVLNLIDIQTGKTYQELPGYVDYLVSQLIQDDENFHFGQLVCPVYSDDTWLIGSIQGVLDTSNEDEYLILELCTGQKFFAKKEQLAEINPVKTAFSKPK